MKTIFFILVAVFISNHDTGFCYEKKDIVDYQNSKKVFKAHNDIH